MVHKNWKRHALHRSSIWTVSETIIAAKCSHVEHGVQVFNMVNLHCSGQG